MQKKGMVSGLVFLLLVVFCVSRIACTTFTGEPALDRADHVFSERELAVLEQAGHIFPQKALINLEGLLLASRGGHLYDESLDRLGTAFGALLTAIGNAGTGEGEARGDFPTPMNWTSGDSPKLADYGEDALNTLNGIFGDVLGAGCNQLIGAGLGYGVGGLGSGGIDIGAGGGLDAEAFLRAGIGIERVWSFRHRERGDFPTAFKAVGVGVGLGVGGDLSATIAAISYRNLILGFREGIEQFSGLDIGMEESVGVTGKLFFGLGLEASYSGWADVLTEDGTCDSAVNEFDPNGLQGGSVAFAVDFSAGVSEKISVALSVAGSTSCAGEPTGIVNFGQGDAGPFAPLVTASHMAADIVRSSCGATPLDYSATALLQLQGLAEAVCHGTSEQEFLDDFSDGLQFWSSFGSPAPQVFETVHDRSAVFDPNGDSWCDSGAVSDQVFNLGDKAFEVAADVYVDVTDPSGCWNSASIGLAKEEADDGECADEIYVPELSIGLSYEGGACWQTPEAHQYHAWVQINYKDTYGSSVALPRFSILGDDYVDGWHTLRIAVDESGFASFFVDSALVHQSDASICQMCLDETRIYLGKRSSGSAGKAYLDHVRLHAD